MKKLTPLEIDVLFFAKNIIEDAYEGDILLADINSYEYKAFFGLVDIIYKQKFWRCDDND